MKEKKEVRWGSSLYLLKRIRGRAGGATLTPDPSPNHSIGFESEVLRLGEGERVSDSLSLGERVRVRVG